MAELLELKFSELLAQRERHLASYRLIEKTSMEAIRRSSELIVRCNTVSAPAREQAE